MEIPERNTALGREEEERALIQQSVEKANESFRFQFINNTINNKSDTIGLGMVRNRIVLSDRLIKIKSPNEFKNAFALSVSIFNEIMTTFSISIRRSHFDWKYVNREVGELNSLVESANLIAQIIDEYHGGKHSPITQHPSEELRIDDDVQIGWTFSANVTYDDVNINVGEGSSDTEFIFVLNIDRILSLLTTMAIKDLQTFRNDHFDNLDAYKDSLMLLYDYKMEDLYHYMQRKQIMSVKELTNDLVVENSKLRTEIAKRIIDRVGKEYYEADFPKTKGTRRLSSRPKIIIESEERNQDPPNGNQHNNPNAYNSFQNPTSEIILENTSNANLNPDHLSDRSPLLLIPPKNPAKQNLIILDLDNNNTILPSARSPILTSPRKRKRIILDDNSNLLSERMPILPTPRNQNLIILDDNANAPPTIAPPNANAANPHDQKSWISISKSDISTFIENNWLLVVTIVITAIFWGISLIPAHCIGSVNQKTILPSAIFFVLDLFYIGAAIISFMILFYRRPLNFVPSTILILIYTSCKSLAFVVSGASCWISSIQISRLNSVMGNVAFTFQVLAVYWIFSDYVKAHEKSLSDISHKIPNLGRVSMYILLICQTLLVIELSFGLDSVASERPTSFLTMILIFTTFASLLASLGIIGHAMFAMRAISKQQKIQFNVNNSDGEVIFLLLFALTARVFLDLGQIFGGANLADFYGDSGYEAFLDTMSEVMTDLIPLFYHFVNLKHRHQNVEESKLHKQQSYVLWSIILAVLVLENGFLLDSVSSYPTFVKIARITAFDASILGVILVFSINNPLFQLIYHTFHIKGAFTQHSQRKVEFHRKIGINMVVHASIHATMHFITWITNTQIYDLHGILITGLYVDDLGNGFYMATVPVVTGIFMLSMFAITAMIGLRIGKLKNVEFHYHLWFAIIGLILWFFHGFTQKLGPNIGDRMISAACVVVSVLYLVYWLIGGVTTAEIQQGSCRPITGIAWNPETKQNEKVQYLYFVFRSSSTGYHPGAYWNLFLQDQNLFHVHFFTEISGKGGVKKFLIRVGGRFTTNLLMNHKSWSEIKVQGPLLGPGTLAMDLIRKYQEKCILILSANNTGITLIINILNYLNENEELQDKIEKVIILYGGTDFKCSRFLLRKVPLLSKCKMLFLLFVMNSKYPSVQELERPVRLLPSFPKNAINWNTIADFFNEKYVAEYCKKEGSGGISIKRLKRSLNQYQNLQKLFLYCGRDASYISRKKSIREIRPLTEITEMFS